MNERAYAMGAFLLAAALVLGGTCPTVASPFNGVWVEDLKTEMGQAGFDKYLVVNGYYKCESCRPPRSYPADGKMRPVKGDPSVISEGVTITGPRTILTRIVGAQMTRQTTMTVAADDRTATYVSLDEWPGVTKPLRTEYVAKRTAPAAAGAHPVSGTWLGLRYVAAPEEYRSVTLTEANGWFTRSNLLHGHYRARIGGAEARVTGDGKNVYKARVRAPDARTRVETISLDGKPLVERTYSLSADGRSLLTTVRDPQDGSEFTATSHRT